MEAHLKFAEIIANLLDNRFSFLGIRFGISAVIDLIPGFGDVLDLLLSMYIIWIAIKLKLPYWKIAQMIINVTINFIIGLIPVIGDVGYIFNKANIKNVNLITSYLRFKQPIVEGEIISKK